MRAPTGTNSHLGRSVVATLFALMLAASGLWASSAGASRGSKGSCSSGGRARDGLGYRPHSAATVPVAANSGGADCPDRESDGTSDGTSSRSAPEPGGTESRYERPPADSPASSRPSGSPPAQRSGTTQTYSDRSARSPRASGNGGSKASDDRSAGSPGAGANGDGASVQVPPEAVSGQPGGGGSPSGASSGGRKAPRSPSGSAGRGSGGGRGSAGAGSGGNHSRPGGGDGAGPGGSAGGLPGFRVAPASPPSSRTRPGAGSGAPGMAWTAFRAPGAALPNGVVPPVVVLPSTAAAVLGASTGPTAAVIPAGPIPRTGGEISASAVLSFILILVGGTMRRARLSRR
jgi:hypothetical protein